MDGFPLENPHRGSSIFELVTSMRQGLARGRSAIDSPHEAQTLCAKLLAGPRVSCEKKRIATPDPRLSPQKKTPPPPFFSGNGVQTWVPHVEKRPPHTIACDNFQSRDMNFETAHPCTCMRVCVCVCVCVKGNHKTGLQGAEARGRQAISRAPLQLADVPRRDQGRLEPIPRARP